ncbi:colicin E3/pyocin S6 family cytotoxin [Salinarimonas sp.]|uniref:colicin E3/pyocin S6 family cytotoxin n=1 Tax=Salinarimonas sp. TaxID=2766526 RepID=UPI0032D91EA8
MRKTVPSPSIVDTLEPIGAPRGRKVWRSADPERIYEWDSLHGELEMSGVRGRHLGVVDPIAGDKTKRAVKGRRIDV